MVEFWATVGRACLDGEFRTQVVRAIGRNGSLPLGSLGELRSLLRGEQGLRLSAWELKEIERIFRSQAPATMARVARLAGDAETSFPEDLELAAVVGLAAIDGGFRERLRSAVEGPEQLGRLLREGELDSVPRFGALAKAQLERLEGLLLQSEVYPLFEVLARDFWRSPIEPCPFGFSVTPGKPYVHVNALAVLKAVDRRVGIGAVLEQGEVPEEVLIEIVELALDRLEALAAPPSP